MKWDLIIGNPFLTSTNKNAATKQHNTNQLALAYFLQATDIVEKNKLNCYQINTKENWYVWKQSGMEWDKKKKQSFFCALNRMREIFENERKTTTA